MMGGQLRRLVVDFRSEAGELVVRVIYKTQDGPGPCTLTHYPLGEA
jgi:hypothetical protein